MTTIAVNEALRLVLWRIKDLDGMRRSGGQERERVWKEAELREEWRVIRQREICECETCISPHEAG